MKSYKYKREHIDFNERPIKKSTKGTRRKKVVLLKTDELAFLKYQRDSRCSEACSEKIAYEIAKSIGYNCARIELAYDEKGELCVLNYFFLREGEKHDDIAPYLMDVKKEGQTRKDFYTYENIKSVLMRMDKSKSLYRSFVKIMIFDALIGEQDRHEENWGIIVNDLGTFMSPLYDNGDSLLRDFYNAEFGNKFYNKEKDFNKYICKSLTQIYDENKKKYRHFDLIQKLCDDDKQFVKKEIANIRLKLPDKRIRDIVMAIPCDCMSNIQKEYIIKYVIERKRILYAIVRGKKYEK